MWPVSRSTMPKHFAKLIGDKSLFQINYEALRLKFGPEEIYVQTNAVQARIAQEQVREIPVENYFIEPEMRNQGPATGFLAAKLFKISPDEPFVIVQADVLRDPADKFIEMLEAMDKLIRKEGKLMTAGVRLKKGVAGIDFMVVGDKVVSPEGVDVYKMEKWVMRDDPERNEADIEMGKVMGHANHYAWTPRAMLQAYKEHAPEWYEPLVKMIAAFGTAKEETVVAQEYAKMPKDPIEARVTKYELAEALVAEVPFEWVDFGTWESLAGYLIKEGQYRPEGRVLEIEGKGNFVWPRGDKFVATIGVEDLVIVDSGDALLVMKKDQSGKVGQVVDWLKEKGRDLV